MLPTNSEALAPSWIAEQANAIHLNLLDENRHPDINDALEKSLLSGGKKVRPLLTCMMADLFDVSRDTILPFARAIELIHSATLAHDDVIDDAETRRHKPSLHMLTTPKKAILAGDYLLAEALVSVSSLGSRELVRELSQVIMDLSLGEWKQIDIARSQNATLDDVDEVAFLKTGSVLSWCCLAPAYLANAGEASIATCRDLGRSLGSLFQLVDDTLDYSNIDTGKPAGNDAKQGVLNAVLCVLKNNDYDLYAELQSGVEPSTQHKGALIKAIDIVRHKAFAVAEMAHEAVDSIVASQIKTPQKVEAALALHRLIDVLKDRTK